MTFNAVVLKKNRKWFIIPIMYTYSCPRVLNVRVKKTAIMVFVICLSLFTAAFFCGCSADGNYRNECFFSMGTTLNIVAYAADEEYNSLVAKVKEILAYADGLTADDGIVSAFNAAGYGEKVEIDEVIYDILTTVKTDDALDGYNPLTYPLTDLWGFTPRFDDGYKVTEKYDRVRNEDGSLPLPDEKYIEAFLKLTDLDGLELSEEDGKYYCKKNIPPVTVDETEYGAKLDLGGCMKGYCLDEIEKVFDSLGIKYGYMTFGTSSITLLLNKNGSWELLLTSPEDNSKSYYKVKLPSGNASTSGDYERYYELDGKRYCHIIGKDGYPVENARSVTAIGGTSLYNDMLSTALMTVKVNELDERAALVKEKGIDVVYCYGPDGENVVSTIGGDVVRNF